MSVTFHGTKILFFCFLIER